MAVFVDGCFWHGCPQHGELPKANGEFWASKFAKTKKRDRLQTAALRRDGWRVVRIWEHVPSAAAARKIEKALAEATGRPPVN